MTKPTLEKTNELFDFFVKSAQINGISFEDILKYDAAKLESQHNFIQLLFPTKRPSNFANQEYFLSDELIERLKKETKFKENFLKGFLLMMRFYGISKLEESREFQIQEDAQIKGFELEDHNYLRLTRIVGSCSLLGFENEARSLITLLVTSAQNKIIKVSDKTLQIWNNILSKQPKPKNEPVAATPKTEEPTTSPSKPTAKTLFSETEIKQIQETLAKFITHQIETPSAEEQITISNFQKSLQSQNKELNPKKAYSGIGAKLEIEENEEGKTIKIAEIFSKELQRFSQIITDENGEKSSKITPGKDLEGKFIAEIYSEAKNSYINVKELEIQEIVAIFRTSKNIAFKTQDGLEISCQRNVFVTNNCEEAKAKIDSTSSGTLFNPTVHGIEAVDNWQNFSTKTQGR